LTPNCKNHFLRVPELNLLYSKNDVVLSQIAKKRSFFILKPKRELFLFKDGSFAYIEHVDPPVLKGHFKKGELKRVFTEDDSLCIETAVKTHKFIFDSN
jgi:hypothetical protein